MLRRQQQQRKPQMLLLQQQWQQQQQMLRQQERLQQQEQELLQHQQRQQHQRQEQLLQAAMRRRGVADVASLPTIIPQRHCKLTRESTDAEPQETIAHGRIGSLDSGGGGGAGLGGSVFFDSFTAQQTTLGSTPGGRGLDAFGTDAGSGSDGGFFEGTFARQVQEPEMAPRRRTVVSSRVEMLLEEEQSAGSMRNSGGGRGDFFNTPQHQRDMPSLLGAGASGDGFFDAAPRPPMAPLEPWQM